MSKTKYLIRTVGFIIVILSGIFMFIFGEYDDSPGGQLIGVIVGIIGIIGIVETRRKNIWNNYILFRKIISKSRDQGPVYR
jgi:multisubunit Na+/H+ antiporter MnhB subunit